MSTQVVAMDLSEVLLIVIIGGLIGGLFAGLAAVDSKEAREKIYPESMSTYLTVKSLIGVGGAIAILLVIIFSGKFKGDSTVENKLWFISLSLVAGFIGHRLLPGIAKRLEDQVQAADRKSDKALGAADEAGRVADEAQKRAGEAVNRALATLTYNEATSAATEALAKGLPTDFKNAIDLLSPFSTQRTTDRLIHIYLGRLYRKLGQYKDAIDVLSKFIDAKRTQGENDKDAAAAYYNRGIYKLLLTGQLNGDEATKMKASSYDDLETAIKLDPYSKSDAREDKDFDPIRNEERFKKLVEEN